MDDAVTKTYKKLLEIRKRTDLKLNPNPYLNPEYQLRYYQTIGMLHMFMVKRLILGDDTGIGKTLTTLATYATIKIKNPETKLMVICPSSVMYQWASEINKFCNGISSQIVESVDKKYIERETLIEYLNKSVLDKEIYGKYLDSDKNYIKLKSKEYLKSFVGRRYQFEQYIKEDKDVVIFNYNTMVSDWYILEKLLEKHTFMVVFDEATAFKNTKANTYTYAKNVSKAADRVYGLSATIIKNDLMEAFSIFNAIMPYIFGNETQFKKNYCIVEKTQLWKGKNANGKGIRGKVVNKIVAYKNLDFFKKAIDPYYLGRKKSEVAKELPEIISRDIPIIMSQKQQEIYNDALLGFIDFDKFNLNKIANLISEDSDVEFDSRETKLIDKLTALIYCQQIANSPYTLGINAPSAKEEEMLRILETELFKEKVVIYTRFKKMVNRLEDLITDKLGMNVLKITGDIKNKTREDYKVLFNTSPDHNIMIINAAAKEGINLQSSGYLVFYDLPFSYGDFLQIIGRIHRIGSKHDNIVLLYMLCKDTVDENVFDILGTKKELFDEVLGDSAVGAMKTKNKELVNTLFDSVMETAKKKFS